MRSNPKSVDKYVRAVFGILMECLLSLLSLAKKGLECRIAPIDTATRVDLPQRGEIGNRVLAYGRLAAASLFREISRSGVDRVAEKHRLYNFRLTRLSIDREIAEFQRFCQ